MQNKYSSGFCIEHNQSEPCQVCAAGGQAMPSMPRKHPSVSELITDRELAIAVRAALLAIVNAIEKRYALKKKV